MIQANELRIGNLVYNESYITEKITSVIEDQVKSKPYLSFFDENWVNIKHIEPIPLTEEWLLKFGFETDEICFYKENFTIGHFAGNMFIWLPSGSLSSSKYGVEIKTIHHLQNLYFSLFEKELVLSTVPYATLPSL